MKRTIFYLFLVCALFVCASDDLIILRNGQEIEAKLHQINDNYVVYTKKGDSSNVTQEIPSNEVYMVYVNKQGNIYFSKNGKRVTGETEKVDRKKYDILYLVSGKEIPTEKIWVSPDSICYIPTNGKKIGFLGIGNKYSKNLLTEKRFTRKDIFMIKYRNGVSDIITPIDIDVVSEIEAETPKQAKGETATEYKVIFHSVKKGETLMSISSDYKVSVDDIMEWNDLPKTQKENAQLKTDMQLMIYIPK